MRRLSMSILALLAITWLMHPTGVAHATATSGWYNNNNAEVQYVGSWYYANGSTYSRAMNSDVHYTVSSGAKINFNFYGSSVTYWYSMAYNRGNYKVYMDGLYIEEISAYSQGILRQTGRTWTVANPTVSHTLTIELVATPNGTVLDIDAFSVDVQTYNIDTDADSNNTAIRRIGSWIQGYGDGGAYNDSLLYSNVQGDLARYTFSGEWVEYEFSLGPTYGYADVYIDGIFREHINTYSSWYVRRVPRRYSTNDVVIPLYDQPLPTGLAPNGFRRDIHTIEIYISGTKDNRSTNTYVDIDRIYSKEDNLAIEYIPQYQTNWCWADVSQVVGQFMTATKMSSGANDNARQCSLVSAVRGGSCPNVSGDMRNDIASLLGWGYNTGSFFSFGALNESGLHQNLAYLYKKPVIERWEWPPNDPAVGHFVIIYGVNDERQRYKVQIPNEPGINNYTTLDLTYSELLSGTFAGNGKYYTWNGFISELQR